MFLHKIVNAWRLLNSVSLNNLHPLSIGTFIKYELNSIPEERIIQLPFIIHFHFTL